MQENIIVMGYGKGQMDHPVGGGSERNTKHNTSSLDSAD